MSKLLNFASIIEIYINYLQEKELKMTAESLKTIVNGLNGEPFNMNLNLISYDSINSTRLIQILSDVIQWINGDQSIDIREEAPDETALRIFNSLRILKYRPPNDIEQLWVYLTVTYVYLSLPLLIYLPCLALLWFCFYSSFPTLPSLSSLPHLTLGYLFHLNFTYYFAIPSFTIPCLTLPYLTLSCHTLSCLTLPYLPDLPYPLFIHRLFSYIMDSHYLTILLGFYDMEPIIFALNHILMLFEGQQRNHP